MHVLASGRSAHASCGSTTNIYSAQAAIRFSRTGDLNFGAGFIQRRLSFPDQGRKPLQSGRCNLGAELLDRGCLLTDEQHM